MTTESSRGVCKYCGSPWHRGWQCKENPKNIAKMNQPLQPKLKSSQLSSKGSKRTSKSTRSRLVHDYDALFSKYLRKKAELTHRLFCFTCGKRLTYDTAVVMHFISRRFISVRFDEDNVHIGCRKCNTPDSDQPMVLKHYAELLGEETVAELNHKKNQKVSTDQLRQDYERLRKCYDLLLKTPEEQLNQK